MPTWDGRLTPSEYNQEVRQNLTLMTERMNVFRDDIAQARVGLKTAYDTLRKTDQLLSVVGRER